MPTLEIVKAWKDEEYRDTLTEEERDQLPEHPSGAIELEESDHPEGNPFKFVPVNSFICFSQGCKTIKKHCY